MQWPPSLCRPTTTTTTTTAILFVLFLQFASHTFNGVNGASVVASSTAKPSAPIVDDAAAALPPPATDAFADSDASDVLSLPSQPTVASNVACPPKCTCSRLSNGWKMKCGGTQLNKIASLREIDFGLIAGQRTELQQLDLSKNLLVAVEAADFANFTGLKKLDLSGNALQSIEARVFRELSALERLKLAGNGIVHVFQGAFEGMAQLKQM